MALTQTIAAILVLLTTAQATQNPYEALEPAKQNYLQRISAHLFEGPDQTYWWAELLHRVQDNPKFGQHDAFDRLSPNPSRQWTPKARSILHRFDSLNEDPPYVLCMTTQRRARDLSHAARIVTQDRVRDYNAALAKRASAIEEAFIKEPLDLTRRAVVIQVNAEGLLIRRFAGVDDGESSTAWLSGYDSPTVVDGSELGPMRTRYIGRRQYVAVTGAQRTVDHFEFVGRFDPEVDLGLAAIESPTAATQNDFRQVAPESLFTAARSGRITHVPHIRPVRYTASEAVPGEYRVQRRVVNGMPHTRRTLVREGEPAIFGWTWEIDTRPLRID